MLRTIMRQYMAGVAHVTQVLGRKAGFCVQKTDSNIMLQSLAIVAAVTMMRRTSRDPQLTLTGDIALEIVEEAVGSV